MLKAKFMFTRKKWLSHLIILAIAAVPVMAANNDTKPANENAANTSSAAVAPACGKPKPKSQPEPEPSLERQRYQLRGIARDPDKKRCSGADRGERHPKRSPWSPIPASGGNAQS